MMGWMAPLMCQAGVFGESPGTGAIHERDYGSDWIILDHCRPRHDNWSKDRQQKHGSKMVDPYQYTQDILKQYGPGGTAYEGGRKLPEPGNPKKVFVPMVTTTKLRPMSNHSLRRKVLSLLF